MAITILKPGILDTLQDGGRYGYADAGINPGGVMDAFAANAANFLVGNFNNEAVLELHFPASQLLFREDALIAICGADLTPIIQDEVVPSWQPIFVKKNTLLQFMKWSWGARAYMAVHGGFNEPRWLNSYSTNLKAAAGGHCGRALMKGDTLQWHKGDIMVNGSIPVEKDYRVLPWGVHDRKIYERPNELLMLLGPEWQLLSESSKEIFMHASFSIDKKSDRMGSLLNGPVLHQKKEIELVSSGVDFGTVQLLPNGQLIVLMADHQTTGGYPRIGNVISSHLPKLAQLQAGSSIRFGIADIHTAEQLLFSQMRDSKVIETSCRDHLTQLYARH